MIKYLEYLSRYFISLVFQILNTFSINLPLNIYV